tara:strand:+ start:285 stop:524 length:240 start_codon:yes stop_codon:yes gene_type:complete
MIKELAESLAKFASTEEKRDAEHEKVMSLIKELNDKLDTHIKSNPVDDNFDIKSYEEEIVDIVRNGDLSISINDTFYLE